MWVIKVTVTFDIKRNRETSPPCDDEQVRAVGKANIGLLPSSNSAGGTSISFGIRCAMEKWCWLYSIVHACSDERTLAETGWRWLVCHSFLHKNRKRRSATFVIH
jgi:hypothetical protein